MTMHVWKRGALVLVGVGLALSLLEGMVVLGLAFPAILAYGPPRVLADFRRYYSRFDRDIIQFNPECAIFDPTLFYRLRPGRCAFVNREFDIQVEVNSMGLRDDEASLHAPRVVVLGDSLAMGWGVAQRDTFAEKLERELNVPVLNAAISSYGTVREMKLLAQLDTSAMHTLVVQYSSNDREENAAFLEAGNRHLARAEGEWSTIVAENGSRRGYVFGEHVKRALARFRDRDPSRPPIGAVASASGAGDPSGVSGPPSESPAKLFLNALMNASGVDLQHFNIVIVALESWNRNTSTFVTELSHTIQAGQYPAAIQQATVIDLSPHLTDRHYLLLDGHMNAQGHMEVAKRLRDALAAAAAEREPARGA